ncbi:MAG: SDR family NAD(P)-dependent oxidoreductase [Gammaproteobacteria bacterium]
MGGKQGRNRRDFLRTTAVLASLGPLMESVAAQTGGSAASAGKASAEKSSADGQGAVAGSRTPTVLITGSNRGIGLEFARRYAARGYRVFATCRHPAAATELQALATKYPGLSVDALDVVDHPGIDALALKLADQPIDILLNNAGLGGGGQNQLFTRLNYPVFNDVMAVNAVGPIKMCEAFLKNVLASDQKKMITVSSSQGSIGSVDAARLYWYRASKSAVNMLMANLALQLKSPRCHGGSGDPGATDTDFMKGLPKRMLRPVEDAVTDMMREIDRLDVARTGAFVDTDGKTLPW